MCDVYRSKFGVVVHVRRVVCVMHMRWCPSIVTVLDACCLASEKLSFRITCSLFGFEVSGFVRSPLRVSQVSIDHGSCDLTAAVARTFPNPPVSRSKHCRVLPQPS